MTDTSREPRRFQFTLRRLLVVTAVTGCLLALVTQRVVEYRRATSSARVITRLGGSVSWNPELFENLIRDQTISRITDVHFSNPTLDAEQWKALSRIPHHFGLQIDGLTFTADSMRELAGIAHLDYVVLNNTMVDESAVVAFQKQRPDVAVMFGYPGEPHFKEFPASQR